ncbi:MAG: hypothetical protein CVT80_07110 [Alphaproteobacteria bacterium HGW-Alphaproteobacteria-2]|nr:MAG: hypothetical protein CVT80_07110 [Alphaproteobacteria bacterium HGW-Alphaproteobacteria-2]
MAIFESSRALREGTSVFSRVSVLAYRVAAAIADWNARRVTRNALSALTDSQLRDIGLTRADLDALR